MGIIISQCFLANVFPPRPKKSPKKCLVRAPSLKGPPCPESGVNNQKAQKKWNWKSSTIFYSLDYEFHHYL